MARKTKRRVVPKRVAAVKKSPVPPKIVKKPVKKTIVKKVIPSKPKIDVEVPEEISTSVIVEEEYVPVVIQKRTPPYMSQYEYCALISARVAQLTSRSIEWNMPKIPITSPEGYDPLIIATEEVKKRLVSLVVRRRLPDGTTEDWLLKDMIFPRI